MLDLHMTAFLCSNTLKLTIRSTGKTVEFQKEVAEVGREQTCDFWLQHKPTVSRHHATFLYEKNMWFLRDNFSENGTWLNGIRIHPGRKYQLAANDEINFAMGECVIFDSRQ